MKSKTKSSRGRSILAHTVLILLSFYVSVFLLCIDYKCNTFSCRATEGILSTAGKIFLYKSKKCSE